ncbi:hypothetical protein KDL44_05870 [bacterium]|nr:hypothetical protein [bacterium]
MKKRRGRGLAGYSLVLSLLMLGGCGGGDALEQGAAGLAQDIANAPLRNTGSFTDTDYDGIPDAVERTLGTDPNSIDTDMDGLTDQYELWGVSGIPIGQMGSLTDLPDANGNGVISALDPVEVPGEILRSVSAIQTERMRVVDPFKNTIPNDQDGDGIPSDYELHGFYYEIDQATGEDWFVKWDGDWKKPRYVTDPTQWSTDGDPWSDWEEATKRNMDQRVKHPGDHPDIPAYPEIYAAVTGYRVDLNDDVEIESSNGNTSEKSWSVENLTSGWENQDQTNVSVDVWGQLKFEAGIVGLNASVPPGVISKTSLTNEIGIKVGATYEKTLTSYGSNNYTNDTSGLSSTEWATARAITGNSLQAGRLTLNMKLVNVGTMTANSSKVYYNVKVGNTTISKLLVEYPGELEAKAANTVDWVAATDAIPSFDEPGGRPMWLSIYQLQAIQNGAPIVIEPVEFEADTLVGVPDPNTGRRAFISTGPWTPYEAAIQNVTARVRLDFNEDPQLSQPLFSGLPARKVSDVRVFAYNNRGSYVGSPPVTTLGDAFLWAFDFREESGNIILSIDDPISHNVYESSLLDWQFNFDKGIYDELINETPQYFVNVLAMPLKPGNPIERIYSAKAPPSGARAKPTIYWATIDPAERVVRAYSRDVSGIKEMRFKPDDTYEGEEMLLQANPADPRFAFAYTYVIPSQYRWKGTEKVVATNGRDIKTELAIQFVSNDLGQLVNEDLSYLGWQPFGIADEQNTVGFNFDGEAVGFSPFDVELRQYRDSGGILQAEINALNGAGIYEIGVVADLDQLEYNYLRKRPYIDSGNALLPLAVPLSDPLFPVADPLYHTVYAIRSKEGRVAVFAPQLTERNASENYISAVLWRVYEGL